MRRLLARFTSMSVLAHLPLLLVIGILPGFGLALYGQFSHRQERIRDIQQDALRLAQLIAREQDRAVDGARSMLMALARLPDVRQQRADSCSRLMADLLGSESPYANLIAARLDGEIFCSAVALPEPVRINDRPYFRQTVAARTFTVSDFLIGRVTGHPQLVLSYPVVDDTDQVQGIVAATLTLDDLGQVAGEAQLPEGSSLVVVDRQGMVVARYPDPEGWVGRAFPDAPLVQAILRRGEGVTETVGLDGVERVYAFTPLGHGSTSGYAFTSVGIPTAVAWADADRALWSGVFALAVMTLAALGIARAVAMRVILHPLEILTAAANRLAAGELRARAALSTGSAELQHLARRFDAMAEALQAHEQQRLQGMRQLSAYAAHLERSNRELQDFAYVASHDLQEPLRKIQAFSDRLVAKYGEALGEQGRDYLQRMHGAAGRMQTMINDLLAFSRVTTKGQPPAPIDLSHVVREVISDLEARLEETKGRVEVGDLPVIQADPLQIRQLLQNLIGNGLKFHGSEPPVVTVTAEPTADGKVQLVVADNGIGFDEKYLDRIFTPFQRLHGRSEYGGTGIGLAICRKIAERHGGTITATSRPGQGATFIVTLPTTPTEEGLASADPLQAADDSDGRRRRGRPPVDEAGVRGEPALQRAALRGGR